MKLARLEKSKKRQAITSVMKNRTVTTRRSQLCSASWRVGVACMMIGFAPSVVFAATVYTPIYGAESTVFAPTISSSQYISPFTETVIDRMPRAWGSLTGVTVEYLSASGSNEASGIADGAGAGQSVIFQTRAFTRVTGPGRTYAAKDQRSPVFGGPVAVGGPPTVYQGNFVLTNFDNTSGTVNSTFWEEAFYDDSPIQPVLRNFIFFTLSGNVGVTAQGSSAVSFSQRIRYDFVETAAYVNAGSPATLGAVPEPATCTLAAFGLLGMSYCRRKRA